MNVIGLDISKSSIDCCIITSKGQTHFKTTNDISGCLNILKTVKRFKIRKISAAMEATGIYYETAAKYLSAHYPVYVINPKRIKDYGKALFQRTKTDKADAALIAEYAKRHSDKLNAYETPTPNNTSLNKLNTLLFQLNQQHRQTANRCTVAADEYIKNVYQTIMDTLDSQIRDVQKQINRLIEEDEQIRQQYQNLLTVTGIGKATAPIILYHLNSRNFKTANQFTAFAGLSPRIEQSGETLDKHKGTCKNGHRRLKAAFFYPALVAYRQNAFPQLVSNLTKAGKPKKVIIVAIMRKLAKICFYIHKSGQPFDKNRHQPIAD